MCSSQRVKYLLRLGVDNAKELLKNLAHDCGVLKRERGKRKCTEPKKQNLHTQQKKPKNQKKNHTHRHTDTHTDTHTNTHTHTHMLSH